MDAIRARLRMLRCEVHTTCSAAGVPLLWLRPPNELQRVWAPRIIDALVEGERVALQCRTGTGKGALITSVALSYVSCHPAAVVYIATRTREEEGQLYSQMAALVGTSTIAQVQCSCFTVGRCCLLAMCTC